MKLMTTTYRQNLAINNPAFWLENAGNYLLRKDEPQSGSDLTLTTVLCVDAYDVGAWCWHCTVAVQSAPQIFLSFEQLPYDLKKQMVGIGLKLLSGVGVESQTRCEFSPFSMHVKRKLTNVEEYAVKQKLYSSKRLTQEIGRYSSIPREQAIDEFRFDPLNSGIPGRR